MKRWFLVASVCVSFSLGCSGNTPDSYPVMSLAFSPDGKSLAAGGGLSKRPKDGLGVAKAGIGELRVWDTASWEPILQSRDGYTDPVTTIMFDVSTVVTTLSIELHPRPDGNPHMGMAMRTWTFPDKKCRTAMVGDYPYTLAVSHDRKRLAYAKNAGNICIAEQLAKRDPVEFQFRKPRRPQDGAIDGEFATDLAYSPDDNQLLILTEDVEKATRGYLVAGSTGKLLGIIAPGNSSPRLLAFTPDGKHIAAVCDDGWLYLLTNDLKKVDLTIGDAASKTPAMAFSHDSKTIALKTGAAKVDLFDLETGKKLKSFAGNQGDEIRCITFSSTGLLAIGGSAATKSGREGRIHVFEVETGKKVAELDGREKK